MVKFNVMNILYGIQGTGNGHISRGTFIYELLKEYSSNVDVLISGENYSLKPKIPVNYTNKGISFAIKNGKIDYLKTLSNFDLLTSYLEQREINFKKYDVIVTDFDPITAWGALRNKIPSIHISHQAAFLEKTVPRPSSKSILGEYVMKYFCPTNDFIGLHYKSYGKNISEPIVSEKLKNCITELKDHITIYLPWYDDNYLSKFFKKIPQLKFHIFSKSIKRKYTNSNIVFFPINESLFFNSLITSYGVICNAGFQTSSEVIYLGKRLMVIPVQGQYEQVCNVEALKELGVYSAETLSDIPIHQIKSWLDQDPIQIQFKNTVHELLKEKLIQLS